jgi:hypothetical protein
MMFVHYANDTLLIGDVAEPLSEFLLDEPAYALPAQALWRVYVPGEKHLLGYGWTQRDEAMPWEEGDAYLAREATYAASYALRHVDTSPNVPGFEAALILAFGGDYLAFNSLYAGWPLFKDALESADWAVADLLLSDSYLTYEIDTPTYTRIVALAQQYYLPMSLQGRPSILPLNMLDVIRYIQMALPAVDAALVGLSEAADLIVVLPISATDSMALDAADSATPLTVLASTDDATIDATETAGTVPTLLLSAENEVSAIGGDDSATPTLVIT